MKHETTELDKCVADAKQDLKDNVDDESVLEIDWSKVLKAFRELTDSIQRSKELLRRTGIIVFHEDDMS